ncbi:hypothetical protein GQ42DRAFT_68223 [Ramicandelaber brevisporus]|nr:hypothetical protein GQ42DRAFT_68223 [Ramicandelaber brevisporus]
MRISQFILLIPVAVFALVGVEAIPVDTTAATTPDESMTDTKIDPRLWGWWGWGHRWCYWHPYDCYGGYGGYGGYYGHH